MSETQKCQQKTGCDKEAAARVYWPGKSQPLIVCIEHAAKAQKVAMAIGLQLCVEELV